MSLIHNWIPSILAFKCAKSTFCSFHMFLEIRSSGALNSYSSLNSCSDLFQSIKPRFFLRQICLIQLYKTLKIIAPPHLTIANEKLFFLFLLFLVCILSTLPSLPPRWWVILVLLFPLSWIEWIYFLKTLLASFSYLCIGSVLALR